MHRTAIFCSMLFLATSALAGPQEARVPGGIAILPLPATLPADIRASYDGHQVLVEKIAMAHADSSSASPWPQSRALPLWNSGPANEPETLSFTINEKKYEEQHITLPPSNEKHVHPGEAELARYAREAKEQQAVYKTFSGQRARLARLHHAHQGQGQVLN